MEVGIIGGGAAGVFCAINLIHENINITLLEKNDDLLKKLLITGNGRCNVTNLCSKTQFLDNVPTNSKFLFTALNNFGSFDMVEFLRENNVDVKVENNNRVFPVSNKAITIKNCFETLIKNKTNIKLNSEVKNIKFINSKYVVECKDQNFMFDKLIIATGGLSYPTTGSSGDGYNFARNFNINTTKTRPTLCGIRLKHNVKELEGLSVFCKLIYENENKIKCEETGNVMFTSFGVSGPAVFTLTSKIQDRSISKNSLILDFFPESKKDELLELFYCYIKNNPKKYVFHLLNSVINKKLAIFILEKLGIEQRKQCANISKKDVLLIINEIKALKFEIENFDNIERATITRGGISIQEINPKTFECKNQKGLYFIGEVLDVDALSGGFNLQIAFSTAYSCAKSIIKEIL